ncbi:MAG: hypothetical protein V3V16_01230 [Melioribacteraceae bacterium]
MKYLIPNIILALLLLLTFVRCDDPLPTELINNEEEVEIEVINSEPNSIVITGYDSTGIVDILPRSQTVISLSGIKNTINGRTFYKGNTEAIFYDTTKSVFAQENKFIGFKTFENGRVKVGDRIARLVPHFLKYRENFEIKETLVGVKHVILYENTLLPNVNKLPYNENIRIEFKNRFDHQSSFVARLPKEIIGKINVIGNKEKNNLKIDIIWDNNFTEQDEIIVGGIIKEKDRREMIPLFRLKKFRKNNFTIPNSLIKQILAGDYSSLVVSFIRKTRITKPTSRLGDIYIASQSIHNIWIAL